MKCFDKFKSVKQNHNALNIIITPPFMASLENLLIREMACK